MPRQALPLKLTYDDYVALPDDGLQHEIIDGEHYVTAAPTFRHQNIAADLFASLAAHLAEPGRGKVLFAPLDVVLSPHDVVQPDLLFLSAARYAAALAADPRYLEFPPDLLVESLSPSTRHKDQDLKRRLYERAGVPEYWLVDPDFITVDVYRRNNDLTSSAYATPLVLSAGSDDVLATPQIPGWELPLSNLRT
jgi:Uma2 family endonuclease